MPTGESYSRKPEPQAYMAPEPVPVDAVRSELANLLDSPHFAASGRLAALLSYIVEQTLEGKGDALKEYPIALEVFGKPESFDSRLDTIVRVQVSKLRAKLKEYYAGEGRHGSVRIECLAALMSLFSG